ncbi:MAG: TonB family protein [Casimicrobium sp.]
MSDTIDASHAVDTSPAPESTQHRWATTEKARTESGINAVALSVRQRKLLTLLATPQTAEVLAERSNTPLADVQAALNRFATLGLAQSDAPRVASVPVARAAPVRATPAAKVYRTNATRLPLALGAIALTTAAFMVWFFARPATQPIAPTTTATPNVASTAVNAQATPTPTTSAQPGATDSATSPASLSAPSTSAADTPGAAGVAGTAAQRAAAAAIKEAAAKVATKDAGTAATKSAANAPPAAAVNADPRVQTAAATAPAGASVSPSATSAAPAAAAAPTTTNVAAPAATVSPPPAAATATPAPALVASVAPSPTAPAAAAAATPAKAATPVVAREGRLLERVEPAYPRNVQYENGTVRARLSVNAAGAVTGVEIISANPPRVFDRSVSTALAQWKYEATGEASSKLVEVSFQR